MAPDPEKKRLPVLFKIYGPGTIFSVILAPDPSWVMERLENVATGSKQTH